MKSRMVMHIDEAGMYQRATRINGASRREKRDHLAFRSDGDDVPAIDSDGASGVFADLMSAVTI
jgi:hypothetical protein